MKIQHRFKVDPTNFDKNEYGIIFYPSDYERVYVAAINGWGVQPAELPSNWYFINMDS